MKLAVARRCTYCNKECVELHRTIAAEEWMLGATMACKECCERHMGEYNKESERQSVIFDDMFSINKGVRED